MQNARQLYVSPLLTQISIATRNDNYIAEQIMPIVPVVKDSAKIATYSLDNLRIVEALRAQGAGTNEINHKVTIGDHYQLQDHALKEFVANEEVENADRPIRPKIDAVENILDVMWNIKEFSLAQIMGDTAILTNNVTLTGTSRWNDYTNSTPIADIKKGIDVVYRTTNKRANTLVFARDVYHTLHYHPDFTDRLKGAVKVTAQEMTNIIREVFPGITKVIVGDAQYNNAKEGEADNLAPIWGLDAWVGYVEDRPRLKSRTFGYTYQKAGRNRVVDELPYGASHETWDREGSFVRVKDKYDQKIVDVECMYLFKTAIDDPTA